MERLCPKCQQIVDATVGYRDEGTTNSTVLAIIPFHIQEDVAKSAETGCCMCLNVSKQRQQWSYGPEAGIREDATIACNILSEPLRLRFLLESDAWGSLVAAELAVTFLHDKQVQVQELDSSTTSPQTTATIERWLTECADHEDCQAWASATFLEGQGPARLLNIPTGNDEIRTRLVSRSEYMDRGDARMTTLPRYTALSYCWGGKLPLRLTHDTLSTFAAGIAWSNLPLTFQHAIQVTRKLGLEYIWIDALCIIQDSPEDFREQAALMGHIYAKSYVNIHATGAKDSTIGFLGQRDTTLIQPFVAASTADGDKGSTAIVCLYDNTDADISAGMLSSRAWVVQERFLSPRRLHFATTQVHWSCMTTTCSEATAAVRSVAVYHPLGFRRAEIGERYALLRTRDEIKARDLYALWDSTLSDYTSAFLTFASDRPVAIQGLARVFCDRLGLEKDNAYVNGIWRSRFVDGLLWRSACPGGGDQDDGLGDCSWSWMCSNDWILSRYDALSVEDNMIKHPMLWCDVIELHGNCTLSASEAHPRGCVRLKGPMCRATAVMSHENNAQHEGRQGQLFIGNEILESDRDYELILDRRDVLRKTATNNGHFEIYLLLCRSIISISGAINQSDRSPAADLERPQGSEILGTSYECLVLLPCSDTPGHFRRVGYVAFQPYVPGNSSKAIVPASESDLMGIYAVLKNGFARDDIPDRAYESVDSDHKYTIVLT